MSDLIRRSDAIDLLKKWSGGYDYIETETESAIKEFCDLPSAQEEPYLWQKEMVKILSAQPERKKGEWIDYTEDGFVECPFCHSATTCDMNKDELHFCFSCGAELR